MRSKQEEGLCGVENGRAKSEAMAGIRMPV